MSHNSCNEDGYESMVIKAEFVELTIKYDSCTMVCVECSKLINVLYHCIDHSIMCAPQAQTYVTENKDKKLHNTVLNSVYKEVIWYILLFLRHKNVDDW